ncbi:MAG: hypothetical protein H7Z13_20130 [Ferruginibacter sp.]|nr:hypothetical protein [Ferruginibacter sp.]
MLIIINSWAVFCVAFGLMLLLTIIMGRQSVHFYTKDVVVKKFSIMDLELPSSPAELVNLIRGLYKLPEPESIKAVKALKSQLYIDFLFMPCAYGAIFILCRLVSAKMQLSFGINIFIILAWLQLLPWLFDIIENIYLLRKINPNPVLSKPSVHKAYLIMEVFKWGIALTATICAIAANCYFWLAGNYAVSSLYYPLIIIAEIILFLILAKHFLKEKAKPV